MVYKWKPGARIKIPAQQAGSRMAFLRESLGHSLTRQEVLEDARVLGSPLHAAFEWNDSLASERFRLIQAGHLLSCIVYVEIKVRHPNEDKPKVIANIRLFHSVVIDERRAYETTARILSKEDLRQQLLLAAAAELHQFQKKYRELKELVNVFAEVASFRRSLRAEIKTATKPVIRVITKPSKKVLVPLRKIPAALLTEVSNRLGKAAVV